MKKTLEYRVDELVPYINWAYFFYAWGIQPKFGSIATVHDCPSCRQSWIASFEPQLIEPARQAASLFADAQAMLRTFASEYMLKAKFGLFPARSEDDDIVIVADSGAEMRLPFLRQQASQKDGRPNLCLADFISPKCPEQPAEGFPIANTMGIFATAVDKEMEQAFADDDYRHMLAQTLCDRLAEATAEKLHEDIRKHYWGYAPEEALTPAELFAEKYQGRRPAVGYPSIPDQSFIFLMDKALKFSDIGVSLTENGMMVPHAAVAGLIFAHPGSRHFAVGQIGSDQLADYAHRRGMSVEEASKYLAANSKL